MTIAPTLKDVTRAVAQLNEMQDEESLERVARNIAYAIGRNVRLGEITKKGAALMLAVHGANDFVIDKYSGPLAGRLRSHRFEYGRTSAFV